MIYVNVRGNFGNQLFEYAFARMLQEKYGQTICLNTYDLSSYRKEYTFNLLGYKLNENIIVEDSKPFPFYVNIRKNYFLKLLRKLFPNLVFNIFKHFGIFIWLGTTFKKIPEKEHKNFYIDGYWQCDKYFDDIKEILVKEFVAKENNSNNKNIYKMIENNNTVCVSIRRGDYITNEKYKKKFYICNEKYFEEAMDYFKKIDKNIKFLICSDDIEWAKEVYKDRDDVFFESGNDDVFEKLNMMSKCNHFILSNSTFSWWAQYLSKNNDKIVIAPNKWYVNGLKTDIYQKEWIYIQIH